jgi:CDP-glycerol glycerophosphotransferase
VSTYPDCTELLLAADVLVTDYSSVIFDFANTGRPMLFLASDDDSFADDAAGFGLDYASTVPGPVLRTTDELAETLRALDAVRSEYAPRYDEFRREFCAFDDGRATKRVVERVFAEVL